MLSKVAQENNTRADEDEVWITENFRPGKQE